MDTFVVIYRKHNVVVKSQHYYTQEAAVVEAKEWARGRFQEATLYELVEDRFVTINHYNLSK